MKLRTALLGTALAAGLAACGGDDHAPGEEVWIDLKGDVSVHQGYALAIVIDRRKRLIEVQVNRLVGGTGNEYLPVLKKGRGFVPARIVHPRDEGLADARRKSETVATYRDLLRHDVTKPMRVSSKAEARAKKFKMHDVQLAFDLQSIFVDQFVGEDDQIDAEAARAKAAAAIRLMKKTLDAATKELSDREMIASVKEAQKLPASARAAHRHAAVAHGQRLARRAFEFGLGGKDQISLTSRSAAQNLAAAIDAFADFAWRYDPVVRDTARQMKIADATAVKSKMREIYYRKFVKELREQMISRLAEGLAPPLSKTQIDVAYDKARSETKVLSEQLRYELFPDAGRPVFAKVFRKTVRETARKARLEYIRSNAHSLVLVGKWSGTATCKPSNKGALFPYPVNIRLELDMAGEGVGVFGGTLTSTAVGTKRDALMRRFLPEGRLPGEGTVRATVRIRVDTTTGALRWIQVMKWLSGPPLLRAQVGKATGMLDWKRPVRFSLDLCGQKMAMERNRTESQTR